MNTDAFHLFAEDHHGVVSRSVAARFGVSTSAWYRLVRSGTVEPVHPNVGRIAGSPRTREQAIAAAILAVGDGALASHRTAAHLWGIDRPEDDPIDVIVPGRGRGIDLPGVRLHRPRDLLDLNRVLRRNIPTTCILRLLCDLGAVDPAAVPGAVGHFVAIGTASAAALEKAVISHSRRGRHGIVAFRDALAEWIIDGKPADSVLEPAMRRVLRDYGLPPAEFHAIVAGREVDFWFPGTRVVLECDGWDAHARTRERFARTADRNGVLVEHGYVPVPFTYHALMRTPGKVARRVRATLLEWGGIEPGVRIAGKRQ